MLATQSTKISLATKDGGRHGERERADQPLHFGRLDGFYAPDCRI